MLQHTTVDQAILALKKGAYLLKCGRRGKPKFHPFRLSRDEKYLIWYSGLKEKQLRLCSVKSIIPGQKTENFQRQLQPDKQHQSFSLVYANGERSLDLICKDKEQADSWLIGLRAVISRCHHSKTLTVLKSQRTAQSCAISPAGYFRRKYNMGIQEDSTEFAQVRSLCGSPTQSFSEMCFSDALSVSSNSFSLSESNILQMQNTVDLIGPNSPYIEPNLKRYTPDHDAYPQIGKTEVLKDVLLWGEGVGGGNIGCIDPKISNRNITQVDSLVPKLLEATAMLDVESISLGSKWAALVTKRGELFSWGDGSGGKLGHKVSMDVSCPKAIDALEGLCIKSVSCGEYQTCVVTDTGEVYSWGDVARMESQWFLWKLSGPWDGIKVLKVACGEWHTAVVSVSGQLFTYGDGTFGVLGHGDLTSVVQPKEVESLRGLCVEDVACGTWHSGAIVGGKLYTWGDNDKGRLGHVDSGKKLIPTGVSRLVECDFVSVCCGRKMTVALTNTGKVYTMGSSVHGLLGNPTAKDKSIAIVEGKLSDEFVKEISTGAYHVAALTISGRVYTWGKGANGQLGLGSVEDRDLPALVEALRDREVESVVCGPNLTAAICLHKSVSGTDQSLCSGCKVPFGLTRKKHNCYNCGLIFCHACSSKKVVNASLALNKSKRSRVCNLCFNQQLVLPKEKECSLEIEISNRKTPKNDGENQQHIVLPKWGQVWCPSVFELQNCNRNVPPGESNYEGVLESNKMLTEEVHRLKEEARILETKCEIGSKKIRECQETIEKAWLLAKEEAAKRKAANEIIKVLALRLHAMSEKTSAKREPKSGVHKNVCPDTPLYKDAINLVSPRVPQVKLAKERQVDSLASSPIVFSNTLKAMEGRGWCQEKGEFRASKIESRQQESRLEWVEQYEAGVYITFTVLPDGQKGLKRVRFSRKRFAEKEAQKWWEENQGIVYDKYGLDGYSNSNTKS